MNWQCPIMHAQALFRPGQDAAHVSSSSSSDMDACQQPKLPPSTFSTAAAEAIDMQGISCGANEDGSDTPVLHRRVVARGRTAVAEPDEPPIPDGAAHALAVGALRATSVRFHWWCTAALLLPLQPCSPVECKCSTRDSVPSDGLHALVCYAAVHGLALKVRCVATWDGTSHSKALLQQRGIGVSGGGVKAVDAALRPPLGRAAHSRQAAWGPEG
jgi:hypothetical protein